MQSEQCIECKRYEGALTCKAYPGGIPDKIVTGEHDHRKPYKGDQGLRFVKYQARSATLPGAESG